MEHTIVVENYAEPPLNIGEILRYAGVRENHNNIDQMLSSCLNEVKGRLNYKVCYSEFLLNCDGESLDLGFAKISSQALKKNLRGCSSIIVFAATIGMDIDRLIARYATVSPTKALLFQAIGAERIESLCDMFNRNIREKKAMEGFCLRHRFSPGYGDFSLEVQRAIFDVLDCYRKIGVSLNDSLIMSPSKSVTAIIGISDKAATNI